MILYDSENKTYSLSPSPFAKGGEAEIYSLATSDEHVAKVFKKYSEEKEIKCKLMTQLPWSPKTREILVLPLKVLYYDRNSSHFAGYLMRKASNFISFKSALNTLSTYRKACVAYFLCNALEIIHAQKIIIGDLNSDNILVNPSTGHILFIDADSCQLSIADKKNHVKVFRCGVCNPEIFPPEITKQLNVGKKISDISEGDGFTKETDYYCLAWHLHMLLYENTPFGLQLSKSEIQRGVIPPPSTLRAERGWYVYTNLPPNAVIPDRYTVRSILPESLQYLFQRAFQYGAKTPSMRPGPSEFKEAIRDYINSLKLCECSGFHHYQRDNFGNKIHCEWCRIEKIMGIQNATPSDFQLSWARDGELQNMLQYGDSRLKIRVHHEYALRYSKKNKDGISNSPCMRKVLWNRINGVHLAKKTGNNQLSSLFDDLK